jgi:hypothetical protein
MKKKNKEKKKLYVNLQPVICWNKVACFSYLKYSGL